MWLDPTVTEVLVAAVPDRVVLLFAAVTFLGSVWFVGTVTLWYLWFGDRPRAVTWLGIVLGTYALLITLKAAMGLERPPTGPPVDPATLPLGLRQGYLLAVEPDDSSFPSGHAIAATVVWSMLAVEADRGRWYQRVAVAAAAVTAVCLSRLVLGVHYPIDVVAGVAIGLGFLAVALARFGLTDDREPRPMGALLLATALGAVAVALQNGLESVAILGGSIGAVASWWATTSVPRTSIETPLPRSGSGYAIAAGGLAMTAGVGAVLLVTTWWIVAFAVAIVAAAFVVGLPAVLGPFLTEGPTVDAATRASQAGIDRSGERENR